MRGGKVYVRVLTDTSRNSLMPVMERKIVPDSIVYTDNYKVQDVLDVSDFHHVRISHSELFAERGNPIHGIENFWNQA
jgi:transposase